MKIDDRQIDLLIQEAQKTFIVELESKVAELKEMIAGFSEENAQNDSLRIFRFFHTINGTASTLGLANFVMIARECEIKLRPVIDNGGVLDRCLLDDTLEAASSIKRELDRMYNS